MRNVVIAAAALSLALGGTSNVLASDEDTGADATSSPDIPLAEEGDPGSGTGGPTEHGLSMLPESRFNSGRSVVFDVVSVGERLIAVGYGRTIELGTGKTHGAAWTSTDGRRWKKTHRLPPSSFWRAIAAADGAVLASRGTRQGCTRRWRLEPDGRVERSGVIWPIKRCFPGRGKEVIALAGRPGTGMVAVYGGYWRLRPEVVSRAPGERWRRAQVPALAKARGEPVDVVETTTGFALVAEDRKGIKVWRSPDGLAWSGPELLPDSTARSGPYAPTNTVYDAERDILLVLATPDRVWRSLAGGAFEVVGPLAAPVKTDDSRLVGAALPDGFLVAVSDDEDLHLQTSPDGASWTRAADDPGYTIWTPMSWMVTHRDEVVVGAEVGGQLMIGPARLGAYLPEPEAVTDQGET